MDALASVVAARKGAWRWVVAAVASAALSGVVGLAAGHRPAANRVDPTYTLAGLSQVVAHDPERWMGRPVWGVAQRYCQRVDAFSCVTQVVLTDAQSPNWTDDLVLRPVRDTAMLAALRRLPLLGSLVPPPPVLPWGVPARYHVQLQALPRTACASCYAALLLDSAWARADVAPRQRQAEHPARLTRAQRHHGAPGVGRSPRDATNTGHDRGRNALRRVPLFARCHHRSSYTRGRWRSTACNDAFPPRAVWAGWRGAA